MENDPVIRARIMRNGGEPNLAERNAIAILSLHPLAKATRTRDVVQLDIGGNRGCTVLVTAEGVEIRLPTVEWARGNRGPRESTRFWKRLEVQRINGHGDLHEVESAIKAAIAERKSEFCLCTFFGGKFPPERMTDDACHGCSTRNRGLAHVRP